MSPLFGFFTGENAVVMASIVAFTAFFLIGRVVQARQGVALPSPSRPGSPSSPSWPPPVSSSKPISPGNGGTRKRMSAMSGKTQSDFPPRSDAHAPNIR